MVSYLIMLISFRALVLSLCLVLSVSCEKSPCSFMSLSLQSCPCLVLSNSYVLVSVFVFPFPSLPSMYIFSKSSFPLCYVVLVVSSLAVCGPC